MRLSVIAWLPLLDNYLEGSASLALERHLEQGAHDSMAFRLSDALHAAFDWKMTAEGGEYWATLWMAVAADDNPDALEAVKLMTAPPHGTSDDAKKQEGREGREGRP